MSTIKMKGTRETLKTAQIPNPNSTRQIWPYVRVPDSESGSGGTVSHERTAACRSVSGPLSGRFSPKG